MRGTVQERLFNLVEEEGGCIVWKGKKNLRGYGQIRVGEKGPYVHRVAYELAHGPIPAALEIDHLCRNRGCVNPAHLEAVTHRVNCQRGHRGSHRKTHCIRGHLLVTRPNGRQRCPTCARRWS